MILQRLAASIRKQDWFTVFVETMIVVLGVFIGLQVNNWNAERQRKASERDYLERLHRDVVELTERRATYAEGRPVILRALELLTEFVNGEREDLSAAKEYVRSAVPSQRDTSDEELESRFCGLLDGSSYLTPPPSELPTATELVSAGRIDMITSDKVKLALLTYLQQVERSQEFIEVSQLGAIELSAAFPDLFRIRYVMGVDYSQGDENYPVYACNYEEMAQNNAFLNALNRNRYQYDGYVRRAVQPASERLAELHAAIDEAIGIEHSDDAEADQ